jgi:hypothetical protein
MAGRSSEIEVKLQGMTTEELQNYLEETTQKTQEVLGRLKDRHLRVSRSEVKAAEINTSQQIVAQKAIGVPSS